MKMYFFSALPLRLCASAVAVAADAQPPRHKDAEVNTEKKQRGVGILMPQLQQRTRLAVFWDSLLEFAFAILRKMR